VLLQVKDSNKRFRVICTEAIPGNQAQSVVSRLQSWEVPVQVTSQYYNTKPLTSNHEPLKLLAQVISDSAVAFYMGKVDMVLVGAQGVVENGGILNKMGTLQVAIVAKSYNKPLYVASESYKFARIFPLDQADLSWPGAAKVADDASEECKVRRGDAVQKTSNIARATRIAAANYYNPDAALQKPALDFTPPE